jgi:hypothetical protein
MQIMQYKTKSQSKALENLVKSIPVKERQKLSKLEPSMVKSTKKENEPLSAARLNLEIAVYWLLSKYVQAKRSRNVKKGETLRAIKI